MQMKPSENPNVSRTLAGFIAETTYDPLSSTEIKKSSLDAIGVILPACLLMHDSKGV